MAQSCAFIGFGEAAQAFAGANGWNGSALAFDVKTDAPSQRSQKMADYESCRVSGCDTLADALKDHLSIFSLVTADAAALAARNAAEVLERGAFYFDMNSVAPDTKRANATLINAAGGRYVDVAVMSPVHPKRLEAPLLVSGPDAADAAAILTAHGFTNVSLAGDTVGRASSIKMIRSIMVKGIEALTAECVLAADRAGVTDEVLGSLGNDWPAKANYNFDRMMIHGQRRAAEMEEVVKTLTALGMEAVMTSGTVERQRTIGQLGLIEPAETLEDKLNQIYATEREHKA